MGSYYDALELRRILGSLCAMNECMLVVIDVSSRNVVLCCELVSSCTAKSGFTFEVCGWWQSSILPSCFELGVTSSMLLSRSSETFSNMMSSILVFFRSAGGVWIKLSISYIADFALLLSILGIVLK